MKKKLVFLVVVISFLIAALAGTSVAQTPEKANPPREKSVVRGNVVVEKGETVREATAVMGDVTVLGHVTGDASAVMGNVYIRPGGRVDGDATAVMGKVVKDPGAVVGGSVSSVGPRISRHQWWVSAVGKPERPVFIWLVIGLLLLRALLAAVVVALFPGRMDTIATASLGRPGWSFLYGLIGLMAVVPVAVLLAITCVGIPLIFVEGLLVALAWIVGGIGVKLALGRAIGTGMRWSIPPVLAAVIGSIILGLVDLIPFVGTPLVVILTLIGFGAVIMTGFGTGPDWFANRFARSSTQAPAVAGADPEAGMPPAVG